MKIRVLNSPENQYFLPNFTPAHGGIRKKQSNFRVTNIASKREASLHKQACGVKVRAWCSGSTGIVMSCASVWSLEDVRYNSQEFAFSFIGLAALSFRLTKQRLHRTTNVHINAVVRSLPNTARDKYASSLIHKNRSIGWERKRNSYLITYLLTYSMEQSPSWEANWFCS